MEQMKVKVRLQMVAELFVSLMLMPISIDAVGSLSIFVSPI